MDLSLNLQGIIAQRLIPGKTKRLVPATEVLLQSPYISDLIRKGQIDQLKSAIANSVELGMHTFDQSLFELYKNNDITQAQAIEYADSKTDLSLHIRLTATTPPDDVDLTMQ